MLNRTVLVRAALSLVNHRVLSIGSRFCYLFASEFGELFVGALVFSTLRKGKNFGKFGAGEFRFVGGDG